jgi:hypothetical protein
MDSEVCLSTKNKIIHQKMTALRFVAESRHIAFMKIETQY